MAEQCAATSKYSVSPELEKKLQTGNFRLDVSRLNELKAPICVVRENGKERAVRARDLPGLSGVFERVEKPQAGDLIVFRKKDGSVAAAQIVTRAENGSIDAIGVHSADVSEKSQNYAFRPGSYDSQSKSWKLDKWGCVEGPFEVYVLRGKNSSSSASSTSSSSPAATISAPQPPRAVRSDRDGKGATAGPATVSPPQPPRTIQPDRGGKGERASQQTKALGEAQANHEKLLGEVGLLHRAFGEREKNLTGSEPRPKWNEFGSAFNKRHADWEKNVSGFKAEKQNLNETVQMAQDLAKRSGEATNIADKQSLLDRSNAMLSSLTSRYATEIDAQKRK